MKLQTRRNFLSSAAAGVSMMAFKPALSFDLLDSIRNTFTKTKHLSPDAIAQDETIWKDVQNSFDFNREYINLSTVVRGSASRSVCNSVIDTYQRVNEFRRGGNYERSKKETIRKQLATFVNCQPEEIAMTRNTTDGVTTVIFGLPLKSGDEILTTTQEHEPYYGALYLRAARDGVFIRRVKIPTPAKTSDELYEVIEKGITTRTKLILICHVTLSGQIIPVHRICKMAQERHIKVLVDGALTFGHLKIDLKELKPDFYAASFHKWGGGPVATGFFYVKPENIRELPPLYGFYDYEAHKSLFDSNSIKKYEQFGTHPDALFLSIGQMLDFHEAIGPQNIQARLHYLKLHWANQMKGEKDLQFTASFDPELSCSLLPFEVIRHGKKMNVAEPLWQQHKVMLGGAYIDTEFGKTESIREITLCNPALFTTLEELDRFVSAFRQVLLILFLLFCLNNHSLDAWAKESDQEQLSKKGSTYRKIPAGEFLMGCVPHDSQCDAEEKPQRNVTVSKNYLMKTTEVTIGEFRQFINETRYKPDSEKTNRGRIYDVSKDEWIWLDGISWQSPLEPGKKAYEDWPVVQVSPQDAAAYCRWIGGRLPTEAEWERAARGGKENKIFQWGNNKIPQNGETKLVNGPDEQTKKHYPKWETISGYDDGFSTLAPVGTFPPNSYGIFDMAGNVYEWTADFFSKDTRIVRGGGWGYYPYHLRSSFRGFFEASGFWTATVGFRCVRDVDPKK